MINVGLIGTGKVAKAITLASSDKNFSICAIYGRDKQKTQALADLCDAKPLLQPDFPDHIDVLLICINDDAIHTVAAEIQVGSHVVVAHTSGTQGVKLITPYFNHVGVFWPLQTFNEQRAINFNTIPLCIEVNTPYAEQKLVLLASQLSSVIKLMTEQQRKTLHLAAVISCNFSNYLFYQAKHLLDQHELSFELLHPLLIETVEKVCEMDPIDAQTGPAARADYQTIKAQQQLLKNTETAQLYDILTESILATFHKKNEEPSH